LKVQGREKDKKKLTLRREERQGSRRKALQSSKLRIQVSREERNSPQRTQRAQRRRCGGGEGLGGSLGLAMIGASGGGRARERRTIGDAEKCGGDVTHFVEFAFGEQLGFFAGLGEKDELAEVAEAGGAARGDAIGGEGFEDAFEGAMHIETGIGAREEDAEFGGEIFFGAGLAAVAGAVRAAEALEGEDAGHGALASIGELELAEA
jgi:hypothetical protein